MKTLQRARHRQSASPIFRHPIQSKPRHGRDLLLTGFSTDFVDKKPLRQTGFALKTPKTAFPSPLRDLNRPTQPLPSPGFK